MNPTTKKQNEGQVPEWTSPVSTAPPTRCAPHCPGYLLNNLHCNNGCNTQACHFDGGDCVPASNPSVKPTPIKQKIGGQRGLRGSGQINKLTALKKENGRKARAYDDDNWWDDDDDGYDDDGE
jgi:hypothetical protein